MSTLLEPRGVLRSAAERAAALVVLFLVPVTLAMHRFWAVPDPMMAQMQQACS